MCRKTTVPIGRILLPLLLLVSNSAFCDTLKIYENLIQCYRENNTQPFIGNSLQILLELIRKIENYYSTSIDIRQLSVNLIQHLRIDGIEKAPGIHETNFITPYRPNGIQTSKYELLLKLISDIPITIKFDDILTPYELCTLHKLISSSIEPFKRGDETKTCLQISTNSNDNNKNVNFNNFVHNINRVIVSQNGRSYVIPGSISKCPIEMGVIRTLQYGSLSPGTVIASIAAGLQPQLVQIKELFPSIVFKTNPFENLETMQTHDTDRIIRKLSQSLDAIDNIYAAGLAGDLAEACIYQAPYYKENVSIGLSGYWNDTEYPLIHYLPQSYQLEWTMTDSELLAGIDSYHLGSHIRGWVNRLPNMRLSQVIEMYYSPRGIPSFAVESTNRGYKKAAIGYFENYQEHMSRHQYRHLPEITSKLRGTLDDGISGGSNPYRASYYDPDRYIIGDNIDSACERKQILNRISRDRLKEQTYFFTQVLQYSTKTMTIDDILIKSACDSAVDKFFEYSSQLLDKLPDCSKIGTNYIRPTIDLTLIIDGSRTRHENLKLISYLSEIIDVSSFGSKISVIHGTTGTFLVTQTNSIMNAFEKLRNYTGPYPTTLSLIESFTTILDSLNDREQSKQGKIIGNSKVILVVSQSQKIRENDFIGAKRMIEGSFQSFTDLYFIFLTNDAKMFEDMTENVSKSNSKMYYNIINAPNIEPNTFISQLNQVLRSIPKWFRVPDNNEFKNLIHLREPGDPISSSSSRRFEYEQYVSPNEKISYKLNAKLLNNYEELQIEFISVDYGDITVCITKNSKDYQCQSTNIMNPVQFNITHSCDEQQQQQRVIETDKSTNTNTNSCPTYYIFKIDMDNSKVKCTENDCRYPDQVRFLVRLGNLQIENNATNLVISSVVFFIVVIFNQFFVC